MAQGLALGAGKPVLPIDSLLVVAEAARAGAATFRAWAAIDARMNQIYAAEYRFADGRWTTLAAPMLVDCAELARRWREAPPEAVAGDALLAFAGRLDTGAALRFPEARADAASLLALARACLARRRRRRRRRGPAALRPRQGGADDARARSGARRAATTPEALAGGPAAGRVPR